VQSSELIIHMRLPTGNMASTSYLMFLCRC